VARQRRVEFDDDEVDVTAVRGFVGELVDRAVTNRTAVGGMLVFTLVSALIVSNALFFQEAQHPAPLFATRDAPAVPARQPSGVDPIGSQIANVPLRGGEAVGSIPPGSEASSGDTGIAALVDADATLVADLQRHLAAAGYYDGAIDGIYGSRTRTAIGAYQTSAGLAADGLPSEALLASLRSDRSGQPMPPVPMPAPERTAATSPVVMQVQTALNTIGYGPLNADGRLGQETADAILRFELEYGMDLTGQPNDAVVGKLIDIGALRPGG